MRRVLRRMATPSFVVALFALVLGAGGTTLAARSGDDQARSSNVRPNTVRSGHIVDEQVKHNDLGDNSVHGRVIPDDSLVGEHIKESTLDEVPNARRSGRALSAERADFAAGAGAAEQADRLATQTIVPRTTIPLTAPPPETAEGGNIRTLATVGSIRIDGLCRITRGNGTGDDVANDFSNGVENESEAKIIVVSTNGPVSFEGSNGPRFNVPEGEPTYLQFESQDTTADSQTGEGKHMLVAASNEDTDRRPNEEVPFQGFFPGFATSQGALVTNTGGTELLVNMYAGIAINGVADQCSFGGVIQRLDR